MMGDQMGEDVVMACHDWPTNGHLIADAARLYFHDDDLVLDVTYGRGVFWTEWQPRVLIRQDRHPAKGLDGVVDFRRLPLADKECARVAKRLLVVKCQDQVCSGKVRWQTDEVRDAVAPLGFAKIARFDLLRKGRPQPRGRRQVHERYRPSTLLIFERQ